MSTREVVVVVLSHAYLVHLGFDKVVQHMHIAEGNPRITYIIPWGGDLARLLMIHGGKGEADIYTVADADVCNLDPCPLDAVHLRFAANVQYLYIGRDTEIRYRSYRNGVMAKDAADASAHIRNGYSGYTTPDAPTPIYTPIDGPSPLIARGWPPVDKLDIPNTIPTLSYICKWGYGYRPEFNAGYRWLGNPIVIEDITIRNIELPVGHDLEYTHYIGSPAQATTNPATSAALTIDDTTRIIHQIIVGMRGGAEIGDEHNDELSYMFNLDRKDEFSTAVADKLRLDVGEIGKLVDVQWEKLLPEFISLVHGLRPAAAQPVAQQSERAREIQRDFENSNLSKLAGDEKASGLKAFKAQNYQVAIEHFTRAIDLYPETDSERKVMLNNRAAAYWKRGEFAKVVEDCDAALRADPRYYRVLPRRARAREALGDYKGASTDRDIVYRLEFDKDTREAEVISREQIGKMVYATLTTLSANNSTYTATDENDEISRMLNGGVSLPYFVNSIASILNIDATDIRVGGSITPNGLIDIIETCKVYAPRPLANPSDAKGMVERILLIFGRNAVISPDYTEDIKTIIKGHQGAFIEIIGFRVGISDTTHLTGLWGDNQIWPIGEFVNVIYPQPEPAAVQAAAKDKIANVIYDILMIINGNGVLSEAQKVKFIKDICTGNTAGRNAKIGRICSGMMVVFNIEKTGLDWNYYNDGNVTPSVLIDKLFNSGYPKRAISSLDNTTSVIHGIISYVIREDELNDAEKTKTLHELISPGYRQSFIKLITYALDIDDIKLIATDFNRRTEITPNENGEYPPDAYLSAFIEYVNGRIAQHTNDMFQ